MTKETAAATSKGAQTKARILGAALRLFREEGYEATTMRMVAEQAGVSVGNAYYYVKSKELLLQAFYEEMRDELVAAARPVLDETTDLEARLIGVLEARLQVTEPYHRFASLMFRTAADPKSPLNPFHETNSCNREEETALFAEVLEGAKVHLPKDLAPHLPELLWTWSMGIVLYWIHDDSAGRARTHALALHTSRMVAKLIKLAGNPLLRPLRKNIVDALRDLQFAQGTAALDTKKGLHRHGSGG